MAYYEGAILDVNGPGGERLKIEAAYDETVRDYLARNGTPDYVYVADRRDLEIPYVDRGRLVHFHRPVVGTRSTATEVSPLPGPFLDVLAASGARQSPRARESLP